MCSSFGFRVWTICVISSARIFFLSYGTPFRKSHKKQKAGNNLFQVCSTLPICFVFIIYRHVTPFKVVKSIKLSKVCLKMVKAITQKTNDQNILFLNERIHVDLTSVVSNY